MFDERTKVSIQADVDIVSARERGRKLAAGVGCGPTDQTMVATAISEIARNMLTHARGGKLLLSQVVDPAGRRGLEVRAIDRGPGIADVALALRDGFTTDGGLGLGLPGARRLMDDFTILTTSGRGTTIVMRKWCAAAAA